MDRKDLAIDLRIRLGDWFRVVTLLQSGGGDDVLLVKAWNNIGEYYMDRYKWTHAAQYFGMSRNYPKLVECYFMMEDFKHLEDIIKHLPEGDPVLMNIGKKFTRVGMAEPAVTAFLKAGSIRDAIDCCIALNKWDIGVELAENHDMKQIETLVSKFAAHLLQNKKIVHAIDLYRKSHHNSEAAKLLFKLAKDASKEGNLPRAKKLCVLAALQVEQHRKQLLTKAPQKNKTLEGLLEDDSLVGREKDMEYSWKGAEAYHFLLLCQRQIYEGKIDLSMKSVFFLYGIDLNLQAMRLTNYEDFLDPKVVYSLLALTSYFNKHYDICSK